MISPLTIEPVTFEFTTAPQRLRAQLLAAWPKSANAAWRKACIQDLARHIAAQNATHKARDISVFASNETQRALAADGEGFIYDLLKRRIVTHGALARRQKSMALLAVHFTVAGAAGETEADSKITASIKRPNPPTQNEEKKPETEKKLAARTTAPLSRTEQIKAWQKETARTVIQIMADTALNMEAQTSLRSALFGLKKLGTLLKVATTQAQKTLPGQPRAIRNRVNQKNISETLAGLQRDLSSFGKPLPGKEPSAAQIKIRQQAQKLAHIAKQEPALPPLTTPKAATSKAVATKRVRVPQRHIRGRIETLPQKGIRATPTVALKVNAPTQKHATINKGLLARRPITPAMQERVRIRPAVAVKTVQQKSSTAAHASPTGNIASRTNLKALPPQSLTAHTLKAAPERQTSQTPVTPRQTAPRRADAYAQLKQPALQDIAASMVTPVILSPGIVLPASLATTRNAFAPPLQAVPSQKEHFPRNDAVKPAQSPPAQKDFSSGAPTEIIATPQTQTASAIAGAAQSTAMQENLAPMPQIQPQVQSQIQASVDPPAQAPISAETSIARVHAISNIVASPVADIIASTQATALPAPLSLRQAEAVVAPAAISAPTSSLAPLVSQQTILQPQTIIPAQTSEPAASAAVLVQVAAPAQGAVTTQLPLSQPLPQALSNAQLSSPPPIAEARRSFTASQATEFHVPATARQTDAPEDKTTLPENNVIPLKRNAEAQEDAKQVKTAKEPRSNAKGDAKEHETEIKQPKPNDRPQLQLSGLPPKTEEKNPVKIVYVLANIECGAVKIDNKAKDNKNAKTPTDIDGGAKEEAGEEKRFSGPFDHIFGKAKLPGREAPAQRRVTHG